MTISHVSNNSSSHSTVIVAYTDQPGVSPDFESDTIAPSDTTFDSTGWKTSSKTINATGSGAAASQDMLGGAWLGKDSSFDAIVGAKMVGDMDCAVVAPVSGRSAGAYSDPFCIQSDNFKAGSAGTLRTTMNVVGDTDGVGLVADTIKVTGKNCWLEATWETTHWEINGSHMVGGVATSIGPINAGSSCNYSLVSNETVAVNDTWKQSANYYGHLNMSTTSGSVHADINLEGTSKAVII